VRRFQTCERQIPSLTSQETCSAEAILDEALKKRSSYDRILRNDKTSKLCFRPDGNEVSTLSGTKEPFTSQGSNTICLGVADCYFIVRPHLYGLGYPRQSSPRVTPGEVTFGLFLCNINQPFTLGLKTLLGRRDNSGGRVVSPRRVG